MTANDDAIRIGSYGLGAFALSIGVTLIVQEDTRMSSPGWRVALSWIPPEAWGAYLAVCGVGILLTIPFGAWKVLGAFTGAVAVAFLLRGMASFIALTAPNASGTAPQFYAAGALLYFAHGITMMRRR
ncbi:hypothetical protein FK535_09185 [Mycolicibacterium sp. 018/SC-01/001]|uniref:hypothetical protein n=1 Tax=Mycolicibacterium sp. 018/SC-01/001 TaxID=2592069 RepID=UPI00118117D0|nr:hypothetical protein [Mycolicibacterium sp. 018/SC-01/001]TRW85559.1 hypothetical protein FK535_09185 [Mycolicibacterium sp. 018/SC-01/001]